MLMGGTVLHTINWYAALKWKIFVKSWQKSDVTSADSVTKETSTLDLESTQKVRIEKVEIILEIIPESSICGPGGNYSWR